MAYQPTSHDVQPLAARRAFNGAAFSIAAQAGRVRKVTIQLMEQTNSVAQRTVFEAFLCDANGDLAAALDTIADGGHGNLLAALVANRVILVETDAQGRAQLDLTKDAGAGDHYLAVVDGNGRVIPSPVIAFSA